MSSGTYIIEGGGFWSPAMRASTGSGVIDRQRRQQVPDDRRYLWQHHPERQWLVQPDAAPTTGTYAGIVIFQPRQ